MLTLGTYVTIHISEYKSLTGIISIDPFENDWQDEEGCVCVRWGGTGDWYEWHPLSMLTKI